MTPKACPWEKATLLFQSTNFHCGFQVTFLATPTIHGATPMSLGGSKSKESDMNKIKFASSGPAGMRFASLTAGSQRNLNPAQFIFFFPKNSSCFAHKYQQNQSVCLTLPCLAAAMSQSSGRREHHGWRMRLGGLSLKKINSVPQSSA